MTKADFNRQWSEYRKYLRQAGFSRPVSAIIRECYDNRKITERGLTLDQFNRVWERVEHSKNSHALSRRYVDMLVHYSVWGIRQ